MSIYDLEMPQSHTTDQHIAPRTRVTHGAAEKLLARLGCTESVLSPCMQEWKCAGKTSAHWACGHWCSLGWSGLQEKPATGFSDPMLHTCTS